MTMNIQDFKNYLELYSADLSLWPRDMVVSAQALIAASPEAKAMFDAHLRLDNMLRSYMPKPKTDFSALEDRILRAIHMPDVLPAMARRAGYMFKWRPAYAIAPGGGLIAAALLGFIIGTTPVQQGDLFDLYAADQVVAGNITLYNEGIF